MSFLRTWLVAVPPVANMQPKKPHGGTGGKRILNMSSSCQHGHPGGASAWALLQWYKRDSQASVRALYNTGVSK